MQNLVNQISGAAPHGRPVRSVGHQTSGFDVFPHTMHCRQLRGERQGVDANAIGEQERNGKDEKGLHTTLHRLESGIEFTRLPYFEWGDFDTEAAGCFPNLAFIQGSVGIADVGQDCEPAQARDQFTQQPNFLAGGVGCLARQTGYPAAPD